jgi:hypothetical protein
MSCAMACNKIACVLGAATHVQNGDSAWGKTTVEVTLKKPLGLTVAPRPLDHAMLFPFAMLFFMTVS